MNAGCEHPESRDLTTTTKPHVGLVPYWLIGHNPFLVFFFRKIVGTKKEYLEFKSYDCSKLILVILCYTLICHELVRVFRGEF